METITISKASWDKIMVPIPSIALHKEGYTCNFPHAVICGPTGHGGRGPMHPWCNQELTHLELCGRVYH